MNVSGPSTSSPYMTPNCSTTPSPNYGIPENYQAEQGYLPTPLTPYLPYSNQMSFPIPTPVTNNPRCKKRVFSVNSLTDDDGGEQQEPDQKKRRTGRNPVSIHQR